MKKLIFIDQGNVLRSAVAEQYCKKLFSDKTNIRIVSRGIQGTLGYLGPQYDNIYKFRDFIVPLMKILKRYRIDLHKHKARVVSNDDLLGATIIIALDHKTHKSIAHAMRKLRLSLNRLHLFEELNGHNGDLADPWTRRDPLSSGVVAQHIITTLEKRQKVILEWLDND